MIKLINYNLYFKYYFYQLLLLFIMNFYLIAIVKAIFLFLNFD